MRILIAIMGMLLSSVCLASHDFTEEQIRFEEGLYPKQVVASCSGLAELAANTVERKRKGVPLDDGIKEVEDGFAEAQQLIDRERPGEVLDRNILLIFSRTVRDGYRTKEDPISFGNHIFFKCLEGDI